jgi:ABC-type multidrug transport system fused ATPase/permease subunit
MRHVNALRGWKNLGPLTWHLLRLAVLSCAEVALRVALPWPMKSIVDHALGSVPPPPWLLAPAQGRRETLLAIAVLGGIVLQLAHQVVLMSHTRLYTISGHLLTRDLRQRLFLHLQALSLQNHARMPVGETVYRLQSDAAFLEQLLVRARSRWCSPPPRSW